MKHLMTHHVARAATAVVSMAVVAATLSCGGGGTGPTPGTGASNVWLGPMKLTTQIKDNNINLTIISEGTLAWAIEDELAELRGGSVYTPVSGRMTVSYAQQVGGCSESGTGALTFGDQDGTLLVAPDGGYTIALDWRETPPFPTQVTCGPVTVTRPSEVTFTEGFSQTGMRAGNRITGGWIKRSEDGTATYTATWDLTQN